MDEEVIPDSVIIRDYVCRLCHSHLTMRWTEEDGSFIICVGCGARGNFIKRSTVEIRQKLERVGRFAMRHHPLWRKLVPHATIDAKQSAQELFDT